MSMHHSNFFSGKKTSPLRVRNPAINQSHIMPCPSGSPFNVADMKWSSGYNGKPGGQMMEFNAVIRSSANSPQPYQYPSVMEIRKRKTEPEISIPSKQFLSEDVMAEHLNSLHLSSDYTTHNLNPTQMQVEEEPIKSLVFMSPRELEERLRKAQRISVCEEVRRLSEQDSILPKALLDRIEKPCTALMIWQPPQSLEKLIYKKVGASSNNDFSLNNNNNNNNNNNESDEEDLGIELDNNNVDTSPDLYAEDFDSTMDMEI